MNSVQDTCSPQHESCQQNCYSPLYKKQIINPVYQKSCTITQISFSPFMSVSFSQVKVPSNLLENACVCWFQNSLQISLIKKKQCFEEGSIISFRFGYLVFSRGAWVLVLCHVSSHARLPLPLKGAYSVLDGFWGLSKIHLF